MKLEYDQNPDSSIMVLENDRRWRIEMYLKANEDETYTLVAMSGIATQPAELSKLQGPYQTEEQAQAARSAIAKQLYAKGFQPLRQHSIWQIQAQKAIQNVRQTRKASQGDYRFHPDDVL
ncbi:hypothetical protein [Pseudomaricurvus sp.]|uniref:PA4575 family protein n=1 Tax=Pseudomaricurvus sp. TaxID=2004510 RepID=UPI003F6CC884